MGAWKKLPLARSELDWRAAKAKSTLASQTQLAGFIFVCSNSTIPDLDRQLFGLPARHLEAVKAIRRGMPLFLYNCTTRLLHGVFEAASDGGYNLDPYAWEDNDMKRTCRAPISRYPAQVKIHVRAMRPPLDEAAFCRVLDNQGDRFRLELTLQQVKLLLELFGLYDSYSEWRDLNDKKMKNLCPNAKHKSGHFMHKSYSDTCSASDDGRNFSEDEWHDKTRSLNETISHDYAEDFLQQKASRLTVEDRISKEELSFEKNDSKHYAVSSCCSGPITGMHYVHEDCKSAETEDNIPCSSPLKGNSERWLQMAPTELSHVSDDSSMLLRLHEADPAVNSTSVNMQADDPHFCSSKKQNAVRKSTLLLPPAQSSFIDGKSVPFTPLNCQHTTSESISVPSQRIRWNEPRNSLQNLYSQNSRKKFFNRDKPYKQKGIIKLNYQKQNFCSEYQQHSSNRSSRFQLGQVFVPVCIQRPTGIQEECHPAGASLPVLISPPSHFQPHPRSGTEEQCETRGNCDDSLVHRDRLQDLLQNGQWDSEAPIPLTPSTASSVSGYSLPIAQVNVEALHYEILKFAKFARPSSKTRLYAEAAVKCVRNAVRRVWPEADVEVFGSFATGLCLRHSDVDLAVIGAPFPSSADALSVAQASALLIRELAGALHNNSWCESINVIDTASMPVLKLRCRPINSDSLAEFSSLPAIAIDITVGGLRGLDSGEKYSEVPKSEDGFPRAKSFGNRHTGGAARDYVLQKIQHLLALAPLVLLLKSYLYHKHLSDVYSGGLGSFSLTLLLAFYLEKVPIPYELFRDTSPSVSKLSPISTSPPSSLEFSGDSDTSSAKSTSSNLDHDMEMKGEFVVRRAADIVDQVLALWHSGEVPCLGTLLLGFLQTFGFEVDLSTAKIVLKGADGSPGGILQRDSSTRHMALWIDDPLRPGVNVGAGSYAMCQVQVAFQEMLQVLTNQEQFISLPKIPEHIVNDIPGIRSLCHLKRLFGINEGKLKNLD